MPTQTEKNTLRDSFDRPLRDLRLSVIDRCNFRCSYCMPPNSRYKNHHFLQTKEWLRFGEILRLLKIFTRLGISKIRVTGGEPLLRPKLPQLIQEILKIPGIKDIALTTNGVLLAEQAVALKNTGLHRITTSLDTLDNEIFKRINGQKGSVEDILKGIQEAKHAGFNTIKINVVVQKGINDHTVMDLVEYFRGTGHIVRFIEYMDAGNCNQWKADCVVPNDRILKQIHQRFPIEAVATNYYGEVASRYRFVDGQGEIGFISSVTQPFCGRCTRMRLSTDGKIYTCLFAEQGTDIRTPLRKGASDDELLDIIKNLWSQRRDKYSENRFHTQSQNSQSQKVEMYQIGG